MAGVILIDPVWAGCLEVSSVSHLTSLLHVDGQFAPILGMWTFFHSIFTVKSLERIMQMEGEKGEFFQQLPEMGH